MKGLTAKVFRTYNASITFQEQLDQGTPEVGTVQEKVNAYNHANRMVAILCNHQRAVPKTHEASMQKMKEKVRGFRVVRGPTLIDHVFVVRYSYADLNTTA